MPDGPPRLLLGCLLLISSLASGCGGSGPSGTAAPAGTAARPTPTAAPRSLSPTASPSPTTTVPASGSPRPATTASAGPSAVAAWFEDQFDVPTGWQPADSTLLDVAVEAGAFVLRPHASSEPAYAWAPRDGALGGAAVEATIAFPAGARAVAGLAVADLDFATRLVLLLGPDGAWRLQRDDAAALRTLASGRTSAPSAGVPLRLRLVVDGGTASGWLGDQRLGAAAVSIDIGHTGLATQATADGDRILVDDYRVMPVL